jgi:K+-transporting ATPase c subunit
VESSIEYPQPGVLGKPRVDVLLLNLALDQLK